MCKQYPGVIENNASNCTHGPMSSECWSNITAKRFYRSFTIQTITLLHPSRPFIRHRCSCCLVWPLILPSLLSASDSLTTIIYRDYRRMLCFMHINSYQQMTKWRGRMPEMRHTRLFGGGGGAYLGGGGGGAQRQWRWMYRI